MLLTKKNSCVDHYYLIHIGSLKSKIWIILQILSDLMAKLSLLDHKILTLIFYNVTIEHGWKFLHHNETAILVHNNDINYIIRVFLKIKPIFTVMKHKCW